MTTGSKGNIGNDAKLGMVNIRTGNTLRQAKIPTPKLDCAQALIVAAAVGISLVGATSGNSGETTRKGSIADTLHRVAQGRSPVGDIVEGTLETRHSVRIPLTIPEPGCYRITAVGDTSVEDMSLVVFQRNIERAGDRLSGKRPSIKWCHSEKETIEAELLMFKGHGAFALGVFRETADTSDQLKVGGDDNDFIANRIRQLYPRYGQNRFPAGEVLRGSLKQADEQRFSIHPKGSCIVVIAARESSLEEMDISLWNSSGAIETLKQLQTGFSIVETSPCLKSEGIVEISLRATKGFGRFGFQVFSR